MNSIAHRADGAKHVPAVDLRPTGHVPFAVQSAEATRERADQLDAGAREHREPEAEHADLDKVIAATPDAVRVAIEKAIPDRYTPELVAQISADVIAQLNAIRTPSAQATASQHTPWCVMDHAGADGVPGWCSGPTAQVTAPTTSADHNPDREPLPVLAARVAQCNDNPEAFGIKTQIWFEADTELYELDVPQARTMVARLKAFVPQLEAMCEQLERAAVDDRPGDPEAQARYMAALDARIKDADATGGRA